MCALCVCACQCATDITHAWLYATHFIGCESLRNYEIDNCNDFFFSYFFFHFRLVFDDQFFLPAQNNKHDLNIELMGIGSVYLITRLSVRLRSWTAIELFACGCACAEHDCAQRRRYSAHGCVSYVTRGYYWMGFINECTTFTHFLMWIILKMNPALIDDNNSLHLSVKFISAFEFTSILIHSKKKLFILKSHRNDA